MGRALKEAELTKGSIDSLLLTLLAQQPMYGYQIIKELGKRSEGYFKLKEGTLYPALYRLEKGGLIIGGWQVKPGGHRRRYYHITEKGLAALASMTSRWRDFVSAMNLIVRPMST